MIEVDNDLINMMVDDLYDNSGRYDYTTKGVISGKEYMRVYYENLGMVTEAVYSTISRSGFGRYKGGMWFFTGKVYEEVPLYAHEQ